MCRRYVGKCLWALCVKRNLKYRIDQMVRKLNPCNDSTLEIDIYIDSHRFCSVLLFGGGMRTLWHCILKSHHRQNQNDYTRDDTPTTNVWFLSHSTLITCKMSMCSTYVGVRLLCNAAGPIPILPYSQLGTFLENRSIISYTSLARMSAHHHR